MHVLLQNPWVSARIEAAVAPYRGLLSPEELTFLREELAEVLVTHPSAIRALRRAHPREDVDASGEAFVGGIVGAPTNVRSRVVGE